MALNIPGNNNSFPPSYTYGSGDSGRSTDSSGSSSADDGAQASNNGSSGSSESRPSYSSSPNRSNSSDSQSEFNYSSLPNFGGYDIPDFDVEEDTKQPAENDEQTSSASGNTGSSEGYGFSVANSYGGNETWSSSYGDGNRALGSAETESGNSAEVLDFNLWQGSRLVPPFGNGGDTLGLLGSEGPALLSLSPASTQGLGAFTNSLTAFANQSSAAGKLVADVTDLANREEVGEVAAWLNQELAKLAVSDPFAAAQVVSTLALSTNEKVLVVFAEGFVRANSSGRDNAAVSRSYKDGLEAAAKTPNSSDRLFKLGERITKQAEVYVGTFQNVGNAIGELKNNDALAKGFVQGIYVSRPSGEALSPESQNIIKAATKNSLGASEFALEKLVIRKTEVEGLNAGARELNKGIAELQARFNDPKAGAQVVADLALQKPLVIAEGIRQKAESWPFMLSDKNSSQGVYELGLLKAAKLMTFEQRKAFGLMLADASALIPGRAVLYIGKLVGAISNDAAGTGAIAENYVSRTLENSETAFRGENPIAASFLLAAAGFATRNSPLAAREIIERAETQGLGGQRSAKMTGIDSLKYAAESMASVSPEALSTFLNAAEKLPMSLEARKGAKEYENIQWTVDLFTGVCLGGTRPGALLQDMNVRLAAADLMVRGLPVWELTSTSGTATFAAALTVGISEFIYNPSTPDTMAKKVLAVVYSVVSSLALGKGENDKYSFLVPGVRAYNAQLLTAALIAAPGVRRGEAQRNVEPWIYIAGKLVAGIFSNAGNAINPTTLGIFLQAGLGVFGDVLNLGIENLQGWLIERGIAKEQAPLLAEEMFSIPSELFKAIDDTAPKNNGNSAGDYLKHVLDMVVLRFPKINWAAPVDAKEQLDKKLRELKLIP
jgi:hypothetical protein